MTVEELKEKRNELMLQMDYIRVTETQNHSKVTDTKTVTLEKLLNKENTATTISKIQSKIEEIMIFLIKNNIYFDTITLYNFDFFMIPEGTVEDFSKMTPDEVYTHSSKISPDILPLSLYYKEGIELVDKLDESKPGAIDMSNYLNYKARICGIYAKYDEFVKQMFEDGYDLLYINPINNQIGCSYKESTFSEYLAAMSQGFHLAIRARFDEPEEKEPEEKRVLKNN